MNFSAASSSSFVVTPGRALERSMRRQRAWILPASAISSICSEVLRMIMPRYIFPSSHPLLFLAAKRGQDPVDHLLHLVRGVAAVHVHEDPTLLVVVNQRLGLLPVLLETVLDHIGLVVVADDHLAAVDVADALLLRGVELDVVDVARVLLARAAATEPAHDLVLGDVDQEGRGHLPLQLFHLLAQSLGLGHRAREAIQDEAVGRLLLLQALRDHPDDHLVGHQVAAVHELLGLRADLGALLDRRAQDVACREVRQPEVLLEALALGPLAGSRGPEEDEVELWHWEFGCPGRSWAEFAAPTPTSGSLRSCASSAGPPAASPCRGPHRRRS